MRLGRQSGTSVLLPASVKNERKNRSIFLKISLAGQPGPHHFADRHFFAASASMYGIAVDQEAAGSANGLT